MDAILAARQLGKAIQEDERFIKVRMATEKNQNDTELQQKIDKFDALRKELNMIMSAPGDPNHDEVNKMDEELRAMYNDIFENENMKNYVAAQQEMKGLTDFINQIISGSMEGTDPDSIEFQVNCGGDCGGCGGDCGA